MRLLIKDIVAVSPIFKHIDMSAVLVGCIKARNKRTSGLYARTVPLRFEGGRRVAERNGYRIQIPPVMNGEDEVLYIVSFCLPRFQNLQFEDKITTVFHELYHVNPGFDGDIRRFRGNKYVHSASQRKYDEMMRELSHEYLTQTTQHHLHQFLKLSFRQLQNLHGDVLLKVHRSPKPIVIASASPAKQTKKDNQQ